MGKKVLTTKLNGNKVNYCGGEIVSGRLDFVNDESFNIDLVQVTFSGEAHVSWTEGGGKNKITRYATQLLFKERVCLSGSQKQLPSGRSIFPFSFRLPQELPSSIEVSDGYVRYSVNGLIKRPGLYKNLTTKKIFIVLDVLDLNQVPYAQYPSSESDSMNLCCWCCSSGPIEGKINTDRTGYVPGEFINATASIENLSNSDIRGSHFSIVQRITMRAYVHSKTISINLVKAPGLPCRRRSTVQFSTQTLQVPAVPPSQPRSGNVMDIEYFLQLCVHIGACHVKLRVLTPLVIGTIPLRDNGTGQPETAFFTVNTAETSFQPLASLPMASVPYANQVLPLSYAEATSVNIPREEDDRGPITFAQQYNNHDWSQSAYTHKEIGEYCDQPGNES